MKKEYDFSKGERGKFFRPDLELNIPFTWSRKLPRQFENTPGKETQTSGHSSMSGCAKTSGRRGKDAN